MEIRRGFVDCLDADDDIVSVSCDFRTCDCILFVCITPQINK